MIEILTISTIFITYSSVSVYCFRPKLPDIKLESRLNIKDLEALQDAFMVLHFLLLSTFLDGQYPKTLVLFLRKRAMGMTIDSA